MEYREHIVLFEDWCKKCKHAKVKDNEMPCDECLGYPVNTDSRQPVLFEEKE